MFSPQKVITTLASICTHYLNLAILLCTHILKYYIVHNKNVTFYQVKVNNFGKNNIIESLCQIHKRAVQIRAVSV